LTSVDERLETTSEERDEYQKLLSEYRKLSKRGDEILERRECQIRRIAESKELCEKKRARALELNKNGRKIDERAIPEIPSLDSLLHTSTSDLERFVREKIDLTAEISLLQKEFNAYKEKSDTLVYPHLRR
jgi:hypothetical protein